MRTAARGATTPSRSVKLRGVKLSVIGLGLALLCACSKPDDVSPLRDEVRSLAIYYDAQVDAVAKRMQSLVERTPRELQPALVQMLGGASRQVSDTYELVGHFAGRPSNLERQADAMTDPEALKKLVDTEREQLSTTLDHLTRQLDAAEDHLAQLTPGGPHD